MHHVFIVNPVAGNGRAVREILPRVESYFSNGGSYEIVFTKTKGDASDIARSFAATGSRTRIYSCGGDGTLHEIINGVYGFDNVEVGCIPCGTGNDYVMNFGTPDQFTNIEAQVVGSAVPVRIMLANGICSLNQCSIGFDASVVDNYIKFKNRPVIGGKSAYYTSVMYTLLRKLGNNLTITIDDNEQITGEFLFAISSKGKYQGGGMMSSPFAQPSAPYIDFVMVRKVSKLKFLALFPKYINGKHVAYEDIVTTARGRKMTVRAESTLPVTIDGEMIYTDCLVTELGEHAVNFILPARCTAGLKQKIKPFATAVK